MKMQSLVLVFDIGTQSARGMIISASGEICAKQKRTYDQPYISPAAGIAEQTPDFYYEQICLISQQLKKDHPQLFERVQGIGVTTIRDTIVCVDAHGKPLTPAILWLDKRLATGRPNVPWTHQLLLKTIGMDTTFQMQYQKSHCNWIRENQPEIWAKTKYCLLLSGYLNFKLTGQMKDAVASVVGHVPFDYRRRKWLDSRALIYPVFPIEIDKQCPVVESGEILGRITPAAAEQTGLQVGLPLVATGSDKACEILGLGCKDETRAAVGFGTQATLSYVSKKYVEVKRFIPPFSSIIPGYYNPEFEVYRGYWLISWFKREFAAKEVAIAEARGVNPEVVLNECLASIPPGCDGLYFQPYFTPNVTMPTARGAIIGFSDVHTRHHIYRAIVEGINFALMDGLKAIERKLKKKFTCVALGGGGSQSDEICQITADMYGIPTVKTASYEVAGLGCAIATFVGLGEFPSYAAAIDAMVKDIQTFEPDLSRSRQYEEMYHGIYKRIYGCLKPLYKKMHF